MTSKPPDQFCDLVLGAVPAGILVPPIAAGTTRRRQLASA